MKKEIGYSKYAEMFKFMLVAAIFTLIILMVYYIFLYTEKCEQDAECFNQHLARCKRARYVNDAEEAIWVYEIKGEVKEGCQVETTLNTIKQGKVDMAEAEGKKMTCYLPYGFVEVPGDDLGYCTGPLKEEIQDIMLKQTHGYVLQNLDQIIEELSRGA